MKNTMKGYVLTRPEHAEWIDMPIPAIGPDDALVKVVCCAPCTTDIHQLEHTTLETMIGHAIGHETTGYVVKVGENVKDFKVGDHVLVPVCWCDFKHYTCQDTNGCGGAVAGKFNQPHTPYSSPDAYDGRFTEYTRVDDCELTMAKIPEGVSDPEAVMVCDMPTTVRHEGESK